MKVLGVDPGAETGLAIFDTEEGRFCFVDEKLLTRLGPKSFRYYASEMSEWVKLQMIEVDPSFDVVVCENFIQRPYRADTKGKPGKFNQDLWVHQYTSEVIGAFATMATYMNVPFVKQEPSIKPVGYQVLKNRYEPGKKGTHILDAMAHAAFYLHKRNITWKGKHQLDLRFQS